MASQQQEKGFLNSSFLVLNLGSNTVTLANSFMLSNPNPTPNANPNPNANLNSNSASDEETGTPHNLNNKTKKSSIRDTDDPEWVPEKKMKRTPKLKPHTATTDTTTNTMEEQQKLEQQSPVLALEARTTIASPPQYLISLLGFFGWKVGFRPATRDYVYQSPNGMSYHSLPKAFETFLDGNSKYKEKPWLLKSGTSCTSSMAGKRPLVQKKNKTSGMAREPSLQKREGGTETVKRNKKNVSNDQTKSSTQASRRPPPRPVRRSTRTNPSEKTKTKSIEETKGGSVPKVDKKNDQKPVTSSSKAIGNGNNMAQKKDERGKVCEAGGLQLREYYKTGVPRCILTARSKTETNSENKNNNKPSTKLTILSRLIEAGTLTENQPVMYVSEDNGSGTGTSILSGKVTQDGIFCDCCQETITVQEFESHAGSDAKKPWENVFLASGNTLLNCLREAWNSARRSEKLESTKGEEKNMEMYEEDDESDDTCGICADGGRLICCDGCPSTFHQECLNLEALPEGAWYCPYCRCQFCNSYGYRLESIAPRSIKTLDPLTCKQCKRKYHGNCAWSNDKTESKLFCSRSCHKLATQLLDLIGISNHMEGDFCWTLLKIRENCGENLQRSVSSILEGNLKLSTGLSLLRECFLPLIDQRTSIDVVSQAIYSRGSRYNRLNYEGFYTLVLQKGEEVFSLALLRFHGTKMAEMPFVGTRPIYQRQGMCHRLLEGVEQLLLLLEVEKLVVPAIPDMVNTWTKSFSFKLLEPPLKEEVRNVSLVIFAETTLLEKTVFKAQSDKREGSIKNPETSRRTAQDTLALVPNYLYSGGFPFLPVQEISQQGLLATNPTPSFQGQLHGGNSLEASGSIFAPGSSDALQAFDDAIYSNMSFESLLRMAD